MKDMRLLTVKNHGHFFECVPSGFGVIEIADNADAYENDDEDEVIFPPTQELAFASHITIGKGEVVRINLPNGLERNWVHKNVGGECNCR
jgi:hypothetical protein